MKLKVDTLSLFLSQKEDYTTVLYHSTIHVDDRGITLDGLDLTKIMTDLPIESLPDYIK